MKNIRVFKPFPLKIGNKNFEFDSLENQKIDFDSEEVFGIAILLQFNELNHVVPTNAALVSLEKDKTLNNDESCKCQLKDSLEYRGLYSTCTSSELLFCFFENKEERDSIHSGLLKEYPIVRRNRSVIPSM